MGAFLRVSVALLAVSFWVPPLAAQHCLYASKMHAEEEFLEELFATLGPQAKKDGDSIDDFKRRAQTGLKDCQKTGGGSAACSNYKRVRDVWNKATSGAAAGSPGNPAPVMHTDSTTCAMYDEDTGIEIDPTRDRPTGGEEQVEFDAFYGHERYHQEICRFMNDPSKDYAALGEDSPFYKMMQDLARYGEHESKAYGVSKAYFEQYLANNCFDRDLDISVPGMTAECGSTAFGTATLKSRGSVGKDWVVNTPSDWLSVDSTGPIHTPANSEVEVRVRASCRCCNGTTQTGQLRVYGGPDQSILMGTAPATVNCTPNTTCSAMAGDPHMRTFDGLRFDFQGAGEFVLARGDGFEVQARMTPWACSAVSLGSAAAVSVNGDLVGFYVRNPPKLVVWETEMTLEPGESLRLPGGGRITREDQQYRLTSPEGLVVEALMGSYHLDLAIALPPGAESVGLVGNLDGDQGNDIQTTEGELLAQPLAFRDLYELFGASWRVTPETSLFIYEEGESAESLADLDFPPENYLVASIGAEDRARAEQTCRQADVVDEINLEDCILDVAVTGDEEFAAVAAKQPTGDTRLDVVTPVTLHAPAEAFASHRVTVGIEGQPGRFYHIGIAPVGSDVYWRPVNPYSDLGLNGDESSVDLIVPIIPGEYELRYMDDANPRNILLRQPFRSLQPTVTIEAPASAKAGAPLDVRLRGDVGEDMYVAVVPVGSPDGFHGVYRANSTEQGNDVVMRVTALPDEPGEYEIRCSSFWGDDRKQVYARRRITIE